MKNILEKHIRWYQIILRILAFWIIKDGYLRYCVSFVSPLQSPRQFIRSRLNEPQRKSLIKAPRESERGRVTYIRQKFSTKPTGFTVDAQYRSNYLDLEIGTITRECARRKQKKKQRKTEEEKGSERRRKARRDEDALLLAPAGDVRRDFLFGPAQPRGSPLLF